MQRQVGPKAHCQPDNRLASVFQTHLWKTPAALKEVVLANGSFSGTAQSASQYNITTFKKEKVTTCIPMPYLILIGRFNFTNGFACINCLLYSCIHLLSLI